MWKGHVAARVGQQKNNCVEHREDQSVAPVEMEMATAMPTNDGRKETREHLNRSVDFEPARHVRRLSVFNAKRLRVGATHSFFSIFGTFFDSHQSEWWLGLG
jgi:hypothetical protein